MTDVNVRNTGWRWHLRWLIPLLILDATILTWWLGEVRERRMADPKPPDFAAPEELAPVKLSQLAQVRFPTDQDRLLDTEAVGVFQPTASGKPESGMFGSVRTSPGTHGPVSRFHEGIDIAPRQRDARGRPLDKVFAIADGTVAYINKYPGNSDYGKYIALIHEDPVGPVYTLYAHLSEIEGSLAAHQPVSRGAVLGIMGNTSLGGIAMERAHLHFEVGLILNPRYDRRTAGAKNKSPGGLYNGFNLFAINPLDFFAAHRANAEFNMVGHLAAVPEAFRLLLRAALRPACFECYPGLWEGPTEGRADTVISVSESGLPLRARPAAPDEIPAGATRAAVVLAVNEAVLGRNGRHLIARNRNGSWLLTAGGQEWLSILTYRP